MCEVQRSLIVFRDKETDHILLHFIQNDVFYQDRHTEALVPSQCTLCYGKQLSGNMAFTYIL